MSLVTEIESLYSELKTKIGSLSAEAEAGFAAFLNHAKPAEDQAEATVAAEIAHLQSLGYVVTKEPEAVIPAA